MRRKIGNTFAALALIAGSLLVVTPAHADTSTINYTVTASDPMTTQWPSYLLDCSEFTNWSNVSRNAVQQTASVSVTGDYSFEDLGAPGNGYIAVLLGPYDPADVSNCLTAVDSTGTVALEAGETYTMLLAGNTGELGDFSFSVDGPGVFSTPVQVSSSVTVSTPVSSVTAGEPVDVTALVSTRFPTADLSGTVEFFADAVSLGTSSVTPGSGSAVLPGVLLPVGTHSITAVYSGNTDAEGSTTTTPTIVTVNPSQVTPTPGTPIPPQRVETASQ